MNLIKTFAVLSGLSSVHRYSMMKLGHPESVLEHTGMVMILTLLIAEEVNALEPGSIDVLAAVTKAAVHDIDELIIGDIPRPTKYFSEETRAMFRVIEDRGVRKVAREMELSDRLQALVTKAHAESKDGPEGLIVAIADVLAVTYKVWEEVIVRNNMSLVRQASTAGRQLDRLQGQVGRKASWLSDLLDDASAMMATAARKEEKIHGIIQEEFGAS